MPRAAVFVGFVPPFSAAVEPWPGAGPPATATFAPTSSPTRRASLVLRLPRRARCEAVTLVAALDGPRLPRSVDVAVSADGVTWETVATRRRREERLDLRWLNGHPQAVIDHDVVAIGLAGRTVSALRMAPYESTEPWRLGEVLVHVEPARAAWDEWLPPSLDWEERRRALVERPLPDREDWYSRVLLAARHRPPP